MFEISKQDPLIALKNELVRVSKDIADANVNLDKEGRVPGTYAKPPADTNIAAYEQWLKDIEAQPPSYKDMPTIDAERSFCTKILDLLRREKEIKEALSQKK
jgi:hypothetical protein